jgi:phosphoribosylformimino-5-aminoimidazole carboxamide ribotide isomerase
MFRIIFVIDILNGNAVHAVKGERSNYMPLRESKICSSSDPLEIIREVMPKEVYIADLNRLQQTGNNFDLIRKISRMKKTMADIGAKNMDDIIHGMELADTLIVGTETASMEVIKNAAALLPGKINVSIDIKDGRVLTNDPNVSKEPLAVVKSLNEINIRDIIILNLKKVGTSEGIDVDFLRDIISISKHNVLVGGGIRDMEDIIALEEIGVSGALVATALHNGSIPVDIIR